MIHISAMKIVVDYSKCSGCRYCELWCSFSHERVFSSSLSRITVVKDDKIGLDHPIVCNQCAPAPCIEVCAQNALIKDEDGIVQVVEDKCIGCKLCVDACPYGAIKINPTKLKPLICDLCDGKPICISKCPTNALKLYPLETIAFLKEDLKVFDNAYRYAISCFKRLIKGWGLDVE